MARVKFLWLVLFAVTSTPATAKKKDKPMAAAAPVLPSVRAGVDLWRAGDWAGAVAMWQPYALAGDADAMFNLGQAYKLGRAVPVDKALARDWYRKAALKGHLPAQANLGILLFQAGEKAEAVRWLKSAADRNEMRAQYVLGVAHWNGDGVPRSLALAYAYLARASAQGLAEATNALGNLSAALSPQDRSYGLALASGLAAGEGVPLVTPSATARPPVSVAQNDAYRRDQIIKPLPKPAAVLPVLPTGTPNAPPAVTPPPIGVAVAVPPKAVAPPAALPVPVPVPTPTPTPIPVAVAIKVAPSTPVVVPAPAAAAVVVAKPPVTMTPAAVRPVPAPAPVPVPVPLPVPVSVLAALPPRSVPSSGAPMVATVAIPPSTAAGGAPLSPAAIAAATVKPIAKLLPERLDKPVETAGAASKPVVRMIRAPAWRIQLGAFSKRTLAEAAWQDVQARQHKSMAGAKPIYETNGTITKLQLGPYPNEKLARDACAKIAFTGTACFVTMG